MSYLTFLGGKFEQMSKSEHKIKNGGDLSLIIGWGNKY